MLVKSGNLFFRYRNYFFAFMYAALFIPSPGLFSDVRTAILLGSIVIACGILTRSITIGLVYIIRGGVRRQIHAETLVTEGIYTVCRNPMYLGNLLLLLGFGLFSNSLLFTSLFFPLFVFIYIAIIKAEEAFLSGKFGSRFDSYRRNTSALLPKMGRIGEAFKGRRFNFRKVISKEHNSLYLYFEGILLLLLYHSRISIPVFVVATVLLSLIYLIVKILKKSKKLE